MIMFPGLMENSNLYEENIGVEVPSEEIDMDETGQIVPYIDVENLQDPISNPGFFYAIQIDVDGRLANCFWVDARSRIAYKNFGEVVVFDPTYLINKYKMPFVPFIGVNNHHQSILFGFALLWDETQDTFEWLLRTWQEAMFGVVPRTIITDQHATITNAFARVFPNSAHHFCMWHITKKISEHLSHVYHQYDNFSSKFSWCIHGMTTPEEFEIMWSEIMKMYDLEENSWLQIIYAIREKWILAYVRTTFCAGMSTSQRSESMNKFFKDYLNSSTPVSVFVLKYDKAIDARYDKVREKDYNTKYSRPVLKILYPMEDEAAKKYTRKIFQIFQEELIQSQKFVSEKFEVKDGINVYKVHQLQRQKTKYMVNLNLPSKQLVCSCHKFEFMGILCRLVLMVFIKKQILSLLAHYLLDRWTRNATKEKAIDHLSEITNVKPSTLWFNNIMMHSMGLAEKATRSEKHYLFAHQRLLQLYRELDEFPYESEEDCVSNDQVGEKYCEMNQVAEHDCEMNSCEQSQDVTLFDPSVMVTKGRPESFRKKYAFEVAQKTKKVSSQKNKKVCSQKIQKVPSQKPKRQTKNMKLNKKETR
ncbi:hypothetical protein FXO38_15630 [Capsicum annuum]|nr:hypothetical protein FXO38_15630 [Capsicum annuum]